MKNEAIIILGAGVMQGPAIKIAKELGYYSIVLDGSKDAVNISMADLFEQIDLKAKDDIETFTRSIQNKYTRIGIMTAGTDFSPSVAWTAEKLGLPGIPYETALNASDKSRMRECFKKAGVPSPDFITINREQLTENKEQRIKFLSKFFPSLNISDIANNKKYSLFSAHSSLVVKPVDNMGARGCRRVDTLEELEDAVKDALRFSRSGRAIIEQYMEGPEFSVDAIIYKGEIAICGLADRHIFFPPYFIEMGHTMPTKFPQETQTALIKTFRDGIRSLGISDGENIGAAKGDIKLTDKGPMVGEIAARLSGGYMSGWTYPYSSGVHPIKAAILMAMGKKPEGLIPAKNWVCAERAFISVPGTVKKITGVDKAKKIPYVNDVFVRIAPGDKVDFPQNNVSKCGNIIASAPNRETAIKAAEDAVRAIKIHLEEPHEKEQCRIGCEEKGMKVELQIEQKNAEIIVSTDFS